MQQKWLPLLEQIQRKVKSLKGDGAYDKAKVRRRLIKDGITQVIPPQHNAVISKNKDEHLQKREEDIETIKAIGTKQWKV